MSIFSGEGFVYTLRWLHFFFGILWIGHLYYFNMTQVPFFAETDPATRSNAIQKLVPRALWWFRWAAMWTLVTGLGILGYRGHQNGFEIFASSWGIWILTGTLLATFMWANVWFIIWPNQKIVIGSTTEEAQGKPAHPGKAAAGSRALVASRTNTMFSIPMLFFMGAASHLPLDVSSETSFSVLAGALAVIIGALELNAIKGKIGPLATVKGVITAGFALAAVLYAVIEVLC
jgi:uncharacterized membrane protein